jgi:two-component system, cell cycle response regulator
MVAVAVLVSEIASDSASGKTDARLDAGLRTAINLYEAAQSASERSAQALANDDSLAQALATGQTGRVREVATAFANDRDLAAVRVSADGDAPVEVGADKPVAGASVDLVGDRGDGLGSVFVASFTSKELLQRVTSVTGEEAAFVGPQGPLAGTVSIEAEALADSGEAVELGAGGRDLRIAASEPLGSEDVRVALAAPAASEGFFASRPKLAVALLIFLGVAIVAVALVLRSLHGYIRDMLSAAKRIGEGDFTEQVPVAGNDEMADLAGEFNKMSEKLAAQMGQLRRQRLEIENSVRRIGEAFASGLDRQALLSILVETAVGTCDADYGIVALSGHVGAEAEAGKATEAIHDAALAAEQRALRSPTPVQVESDGAHALASSLGRIGTTEAPVGAMTVAREGRAFSRGEREVFLYLLGQATTSVENVALHELVSEQAVTDDLTGLANKRAFRETMDREAARAARFGHDLSLLMVDLDDFKAVNDRYGHLQGDEVLRAVSQILRAESRGIDLPGRYGGEEFVIALPETDREGAIEVAERVRERVEAERVPLLESAGTLLVTASLGVATMPGGGADVVDLISAADSALYEAKRSGKNIVRSAPVPAEPLASPGQQ